MTWVVLALLSALFLGIYEVFKKCAVRENAVFPILFISNGCAALFWLPWIVWSIVDNGSVPLEGLRVQSIGIREHLQLLLKSVIVGISWIFAYFALKALPVSIVGPIRATSPFWTLLGALLVFQERPSQQQWLGMAITLTAFFLFSLAGKKEGVHFHRNRAVWWVIVATLIGASSSLYDKYLLSEANFTPATVQAWFSVYLLLFFVVPVFGWWKRWWPRGEFQWRWSIVMIGLTLLLSDYVYFTALKDEEALVSAVSCVRRGSVLVPFAAGYVMFGESNYVRKLPCVIGVLLGIAFIVLG